MGEEKVNSVDEKENLMEEVILDTCGLMVITLIIIVYIVKSIFQNNLSGTLSFSLATLCVFLWAFICYIIVKTYSVAGREMKTKNPHLDKK